MALKTLQISVLIESNEQQCCKKKFRCRKQKLRTKHKSEVLNNIFPRGKTKVRFNARDFPQVRRRGSNGESVFRLVSLSITSALWQTPNTMLTILTRQWQISKEIIFNCLTTTDGIVVQTDTIRQLLSLVHEQYLPVIWSIDPWGKEEVQREAVKVN